MQLAERLEDRRLVREIEVALLREEAREHELVRGRPAQADVGIAIADDLVVRAVVVGGEPRIAECGQRVGGDGNGVALADDDDGGHGRERGPARRRIANDARSAAGSRRSLYAAACVPRPAAGHAVLAPRSPSLAPCRRPRVSRHTRRAPAASTPAAGVQAASARSPTSRIRAARSPSRARQAARESARRRAAPPAAAPAFL